MKHPVLPQLRYADDVVQDRVDPDQRVTRPSSTAADKVPRYTPIGILRVGVGSIWAMSEWGKESQTIVLFDVAAIRVRKLTSADVSGC
jgi:hypothetical protein